jgi:5-methylcytosine-specific restriction endonuclease McrA
MTPCPKPQPRALTKRTTKAQEARTYRDVRQAVLARDRFMCRLCGGQTRLETHHVTPRSSFGPKRVTDKHAARNLIALCQACHNDVTGHVLRLVALTADGADGPVRAERWDRGWSKHI